MKATTINKLYIMGAFSLCPLMSNSALAAIECTPSAANRPVCPAGEAPENASFIDPTASIPNPGNVRIGQHSYVAPFTLINTTSKAGVSLGEKSNVQDNVVLNAGAPISIGDEVILAHGARVNGPAIIGRSSANGQRNAAFIGFNSLLDGANLEYDAMILHLARVSPGITVRTGYVVLSGKNITTQAQADNPSLGKVIPVTDALRLFMDGVLHVNETFAREYTRLYYDNASNVTGINYDPSDGGTLPGFNAIRDLPVLAGVETRNPNYRNRIIGKVVMDDSAFRLNDTRVMANSVSLRADEGEPFHVGAINYMGEGSTFHALEHTGINIGSGVSYGVRSLVHGGASAATQNNPHSDTQVGNNTSIGDYSVVFRSVIGERSTIGCGSLVDGSLLPPATKIASRTIVLNYGFANAQTYPVEWNPGCRR